ncbi:MAG TPA: response regulator [Elusimicrobiota bacterium]|nr:response regulator [Elusimicrobiota bacterium]
MADEKPKKPRVVWADDDLSLQIVMREVFEPHFELLYYSRGENLLAEIDGLHPDIIILDVDMPGVNGFDVCRQIRSKKGLSAVPILFLTASRADQDYIKNRLVGGTAYLTKPMMPDDLLAKIRQLL